MFGQVNQNVMDYIYSSQKNLKIEKNSHFSVKISF